MKFCVYSSFEHIRARFSTHAHFYDVSAHVCAQNLTKKRLMVSYPLMSLSSKFHKDPSFGLIIFIDSYQVDQ